MSERYELLLTRTARRALSELLPIKVVAAAWVLVQGDLVLEPKRVGKRLNPPFESDWVARRSTYRIRYGIDEERHRVIVYDVRPRADAYRYPGRR